MKTLEQALSHRGSGDSGTPTGPYLAPSAGL